MTIVHPAVAEAEKTNKALAEVLRKLTLAVVEDTLYEEMGRNRFRVLNTPDYVLMAAVSLGGITDETLAAVSSNVIAFKQIISELGYGNAFQTVEALDVAVTMAEAALKTDAYGRVAMLINDFPLLHLRAAAKEWEYEEARDLQLRRERYARALE